MRLTFLGGAGTVTGSRFLVETDGARLLVDCGLFQGVKRLRERNWRSLPLDPAALDAVVLTHAHLDHSGWLPVLVRAGYHGPVHATAATADLCAILLPDSGHLQEEDAEYANRKGFSRHRPALPLYTAAEGLAAARRIRPLPLEKPLRVGSFELRLLPAGHILGAASVRVSGREGTILFSGDLGRPDDLLMPPPAPPPPVDWLVLESTYGDRRHPGRDPVAYLEEVLRGARDLGGALLVPAFAVGRAQALLLALSRVFERTPELRAPVFVDSPMACDVSDLYLRYPGGHRLSEAECRAAFGIARFTRSVDESKAINDLEGLRVILSASGMATGGHVLHHLTRLAPDPSTTILFAGFQAPGTRGARLVAGAERVRIHGRDVPVRARVLRTDLFSAHADRDELVQWVRRAPSSPRLVCLVHGEPEAADRLRAALRESAGVEARAAEQGEAVELRA